MESLVFATNNRHKVEEIRAILNGIAVISDLKETGCFEKIPEDYETLQENAAQKALFIFNKYGKDCFADDTGLEIDALNGEPGVYSARYAGENCTFEDNMNLVLKKLKGITNRKAQFKTVIALVRNGSVRYFEGVVSGEITTEKRGSNGFGYDPIFIPDGHSLTFGEMTAEMKNSISHRAHAIDALVHYLKGFE